MAQPERHDEHLTGEDITGDKVMFAFTLMGTTTFGGEPFDQEALLKVVTTSMADTIALLLKDYSEQARTEIIDRLRSLWAVYEEHQGEGSTWNFET